MTRLVSQHEKYCSQKSGRSLYKREVTSEPDTVCRSNGVCGWEVYDSYTRNREYYVSSSCKCTAAELCIRMEDDISISAYVYRCRSPRNKNKNKTTTRPASNASNTSNINTTS
ncbi:unnamed protein product [Allacma fusca]|uniref:Uncharacterized protein n=1 Tax=Allacma fusca TaxID=39272 RepID=A0A8J2PDN7_9HEXA|nr:unnamed protein product [Allacma fusca]